MYYKMRLIVGARDRKSYQELLEGARCICPVINYGLPKLIAAALHAGAPQGGKSLPVRSQRADIIQAAPHLKVVKTKISILCTHSFV